MKFKGTCLILIVLFALSGCDLENSNTGIDEKPFFKEESALAAQSGESFQFDLTELSKGIITTFTSPYVTVTESPAGQYVIKINLRPKGYDHYKKILFSVYNSSDAQGWTVNIGDSATNNGYGGDAGTQTHDAELQVYNGNLAVYSSQIGGTKQLYSASGYNVSSGAGNVRYEISNNQVKMWKNSDTSNTVTINNGSLFALDGRQDQEGGENFDVYAGFNRTVGSSGRSGSGITSVYVYLQDKISYSLINVDSDYSGTLEHLMYKKKVLSDKWYANSDFSGYDYFLNGKNKDDWNEKENEHIFAMEYWTPAVANIENIVFLVAGQQGNLLDRQDPPNIVTGQKKDWHHYDGAPWGATNTWKYMKNDTKTVRWQSLAGQIIADGTINNGNYFGFKPSNTYMVMFFDACYYWEELSESAKTALVTDFLEYLWSKVNNNPDDRIKNIYLAGASRGGALVARMAYNMRHLSTWGYRMKSANLIVSMFDGVANQEEGELWTSSATITNPLDWTGYRHCYKSDFDDYFTSVNNTHILQIAGGADVVPVVGLKYHAFYFDEKPYALEFNWVNRSHTEIGRNWHDDTTAAHLKWLAEWVVK